MEALKRLLANLRKTAQFSKAEPATSGPQLKPEQATEGFSRKGKIVGFAAILLVLVAAGKTCSKSNQKQHQTSVEQKRVEELQKELSDRNDLLQTLRNQPEPPPPEPPTFDPSALTPAQLQAVLKASGAPGLQTGSGANGTAPGSYGATTSTAGGTSSGTAKEQRTDWISYRSSQKEPEKAKGSGQPDLVNVSSIERQPMKPEPPKEEEERASEKQPVPDELQQSTGDKYFVRKGTLIPCTEQLRINGAFAGNINCLVSVPVYSRTGAHLLIPQYSLLLGRVTKVESTNAERLFVSFTELIMPDGYTLRVSPQDGLSANGETGLRDKVDRHTARIFGTSLAMAAIGGLAQIGSGGNSGLYTYSPMDQYRAGVTQNIASSSMQILNRRLDDKPTFVIREGARNNVILDQDVRLPDYKRHQMREDL